MKGRLEPLTKGIIYALAIIIGIALALGIIALCIYLFTPPEITPFINELSTDPNNYRTIHPQMKAILLSDEAADLLPDRIVVEDSTEYCYRFIHDNLEQRYLLFLEQSYAAEDDFNNEVMRIKSNSYSEDKLCGEIEYIVFNMPEVEHIMRYLNYDGSIWSRGYNFQFQAVRIDNERNRIAYLISSDNDNTRQKGVIVEFLKEYLEDTGNILRISHS